MDEYDRILDKSREVYEETTQGGYIVFKHKKEEADARHAALEKRLIKAEEAKMRLIKQRKDSMINVFGKKESQISAKISGIKLPIMSKEVVRDSETAKNSEKNTRKMNPNNQPTFL